MADKETFCPFLSASVVAAGPRSGTIDARHCIGASCELSVLVDAVQVCGMKLSMTAIIEELADHEERITALET